jgi:hypothetical protein
MLTSPWTKLVALAFKVDIALRFHFLRVTCMIVSSRRGRSIYIWHQRLLLRKRSQVFLCMRCVIPFQNVMGLPLHKFCAELCRYCPSPAQYNFMFSLEAL